MVLLYWFICGLLSEVQAPIRDLAMEGIPMNLYISKTFGIANMVENEQKEYRPN